MLWRGSRSGRALETLRLAMSHVVGKALLLFIVLLVLDVLYSSAPWPERWSYLWSWRKLLWGFIALGLFAEDQWKFRFIKVFLIVASCGLAMSYIGWSGLIPSKPGHFPGVFFTNHATQGIDFRVGYAVLSRDGAHRSSRLAKVVLLRCVRISDQYRIYVNVAQ